MAKYAITVLANSTEPADRGRMVHAAHLVTELREAGHDVKLIFGGQGVTWIPLFEANEHPFAQAYGQHYKNAKDITTACNMCTIRFDVKDAVAQAGIPIHGEDHDHMELGPLVSDGYQLITF